MTKAGRSSTSEIRGSVARDAEGVRQASRQERERAHRSEVVLVPTDGLQLALEHVERLVVGVVDMERRPGSGWHHALDQRKDAPAAAAGAITVISLFRNQMRSLGGRGHECVRRRHLSGAHEDAGVRASRSRRMLRSRGGAASRGSPQGRGRGSSSRVYLCHCRCGCGGKQDRADDRNGGRPAGGEAGERGGAAEPE